MRGAQSKDISQDSLRQGKFKHASRRQFNRLKPFIGFQKEILDTVQGVQVTHPGTLPYQVIDLAHCVAVDVFPAQADGSQCDGRAQTGIQHRSDPVSGQKNTD